MRCKEGTTEDGGSRATTQKGQYNSDKRKGKSTTLQDKGQRHSRKTTAGRRGPVGQAHIGRGKKGRTKEDAGDKE
eukprot:scaffold9438_cov129-Isochrysis_galbana.AAC.2